MGLQLGSLTPLMVVFYNAIWGYAAGWWLNWAATDNRRRTGWLRVAGFPAGKPVGARDLIIF